MKCDACQKEWVDTASSIVHLQKCQTHYCSKECRSDARSKGGAQYKICIQSCLKKYGVEHTTQLESTKEKSRRTCLERFGELNGYQSPESKRAIREKYGVNNVMQSPLVKQKFRQTMVKRYGVPYSMQCADIKKKYDQETMKRKRHETMKRNQSYSKSSIEDEFFNELCARYEKHDVNRQVEVNGWSIDFYIKSIDTYIQFDGVYWHGLDRPIERIVEYRTPQEKAIHKTYLRDQEQVQWFADNGLRLVRITDSQFKSNPIDCLQQLSEC